MFSTFDQIFPGYFLGLLKYMHRENNTSFIRRYFRFRVKTSLSTILELTLNQFCIKSSSYLKMWLPKVIMPHPRRAKIWTTLKSWIFYFRLFFLNNSLHKVIFYTNLGWKLKKSLQFRSSFCHFKNSQSHWRSMEISRMSLLLCLTWRGLSLQQNGHMW